MYTLRAVCNRLHPVIRLFVRGGDHQRLLSNASFPSMCSIEEGTPSVKVQKLAEKTREAAEQSPTGQAYSSARGTIWEVHAKEVQKIETRLCEVGARLAFILEIHKEMNLHAVKKLARKTLASKETPPAKRWAICDSLQALEDLKKKYVRTFRQYERAYGVYAKNRKYHSVYISQEYESKILMKNSKDLFPSPRSFI